MISPLSEQLKEEFREVLIIDELNISSPFAAWGFEVPNGWYGLLHEAFYKMSLRIKEEQAVVRVRQVKEKYGTLRLYIETNDNGCDDIADDAEDKSSTTCEVCGAIGNLSAEGWYRVRCERHLNTDAIAMKESQIIRIAAQLVNKV